MIRRRDAGLALGALGLVLGLIGTGQSQPSTPQQPARDTPAQQRNPAEPSGTIGGRVLASDTGRPVARARVFITAQQLPQGRGVLTDENGVFEFAGLPAGRYTLNVSKMGFIGLSYGQRRPLQAGTPLQLADGQQINGIEFRLPHGSAIAGRVFDENGDAMPGLIVQVLRYQYAQGNRQLVPAGSAQTDDRGQYRVWGLNPGDYYVTASAPAASGGRPIARGGPGAWALPADVGRGGFGGANDEPVGYAPTFYPGVSSASDAQPIAVALGGEVLDVNFNLSLVRTARVSGQVIGIDGVVAWSGNVVLSPESPVSRSGPFGTNLGGRIRPDGTFALLNVPPGRYTLQARTSPRDDLPRFAAQPVTVAGSDVSLTVVLSPGATIAGTVTLQATVSATLPDVNQFRLTASPLDGPDVFSTASARPERDGTFLLDGIREGQHWIRSQAPRDWVMKSVVVAGRDMTDVPIGVRAGETLSGVRVTFTDRISEISGTLTSQQGVPITEYTILAFPTESGFWRPQSRQIMTTRPDQNGKFQIRGLPPGEYYLAAVDSSEPGEWFEPAFLDQQRNGAFRLTLGEGDVKTQDFKVITR